MAELLCKAFKRNCPKCSKELCYSRKDHYINATKKNVNCRSCSKIGRLLSAEHKVKLSESRRGKKRGPHSIKTIEKIRLARQMQPEPMLGKAHSIETRRKLSIANKGKLPSIEARKKMSKSQLGKRHSAETLLKMRLSHLSRIERNFGQVMPNYNPEACKLIEEYGKEHGFNFQHAENGGEFYIKELGYWVDGYDKEKNIVIEFYEPWHTKQQERDLIRQQEITSHLGCEFIVLHKQSPMQERN